jgi:hypothetical protein
LSRTAAIAVISLLLLGAMDDGAQAILDRTKTTTATFAAYDWMTGRDEKGRGNDMWVAEFRSGGMYRAETAYVRVVIDCRTHEGYSLNVQTSEVSRDDTLYTGDCGISTSGTIESVARLPSINDSRFGPLDAIKVIDATRIRYYQVDRRGAIIRANWTARDGATYPCVQTEPIARLDVLPSGDIFSKASLTSSFVATQYRRPPPSYPAAALSGKPCRENV